MGQVARLIGGELVAEYRNPALVRKHVGPEDFCDMDRLMKAVEWGVPVDVADGGDLTMASQYENNAGTSAHKAAL